MNKCDSKCRPHDVDGNILPAEEEVLVLDIIEDSKNTCSRIYKSRPVSEWVLLMACCVCNSLMIGYSYGMGALFLEMKESFNSTRAETATVQSITIGIMNCGGLISPLIASIIGIGNTLLIGTSIACLAIVCGFFVDTIHLLVVVIGVIGGLGLCNIFICMFVAIGKIFKQSYQLALAALILSGGVGYFIFPYINVLILKTYSWRGVFLIHTGLLLHCIPLALYIRILLPKDLSNHKENKSCFSNTYFESHVSLWKDSLHVTFFICLVLRSVPLGLVTYFMLDIAVYKNFSSVDGSIFLSAVGFGNIMGRVLILVTRGVVKISPVIEYALHIIFTGMALFLLGIGKDFGLIIASCTIFGLGYGLLTSTSNIAVFDIAGANRYPTALGISNTGVGIGFGIAGPIGGVIKDNVESYDHILFGFAIVCTLSGLWLLVVACFRSKMNKGSN
ncbi:hypothetical protein SNE40_022968 [Patella caerulea]|uniref:Uncharacterized protein n=1 Tax=Patella caerulea TaxID=87958 RepID=A0AAN8IY57_PATCE